MISRTICGSGGRILRLSSLVSSNSNFTTMNSRVKRIAMKTCLRGYSIAASSRNEQQISVRQKELEPPRSAHVKIEVIDRMSDLVFHYLRDKNVSFSIALESVTQEKTQEYILLVLENCRTSLVLELRSKLSYAGITQLQFSQAISKVLHTLESEPDSNIVFEGKMRGRKEIIRIIDHLKLDDVEYDCVRILLSLQENGRVNPGLWAI